MARLRVHRADGFEGADYGPGEITAKTRIPLGIVGKLVALGVGAFLSVGAAYMRLELRLSQIAGELAVLRIKVDALTPAHRLDQLHRLTPTEGRHEDE